MKKIKALARRVVRRRRFSKKIPHDAVNARLKELLINFHANWITGYNSLPDEVELQVKMNDEDITRWKDGLCPKHLIVLVPVLGFTAEGYRLGRGGGVYDSIISVTRRLDAILDRKTIFIGVAADDGEVYFEVEPHDEQLDYIVTETRTLKFR